MALKWFFQRQSFPIARTPGEHHPPECGCLEHHPPALVEQEHGFQFCERHFQSCGTPGAALWQDMRHYPPEQAPTTALPKVQFPSTCQLTAPASTCLVVFMQVSAP